MITLIEALNYRCLRYIRQPVAPFHVLIGPNASGKTTFLDVVSFLGRLVTDGVEAAVAERTENFADLLWQREGSRFELAIEATLPEPAQVNLLEQESLAIRYEIAIGSTTDSPFGELGILDERVFLKPLSPLAHDPRLIFPDHVNIPDTILHRSKAGWRTIVSKKLGSNDSFAPETRGSKRNWVHSFKLGHRKTALGSLPPDEKQFPASLWLRGLLVEGVQQFILNSTFIRRPSPPNQRSGFRTDGSNLPWVVHQLFSHHPERFHEWMRHLRTTLPDLIRVHSVLRAEDRHRYLTVEYENGLLVPSWMVSDGTLRMLALTLPAYLPDFHGIYLIEEPENGVHPRAVETVYQSLSSVYDAQLLLASHSPVILGCATADTILCFAKNDEGATDIVRGSEHPRLQEWQGETNIGQLFAAGVLG